MLPLGLMGGMAGGGGGMPGLSDQSMSSASLNVGQKTSGINLAGAERGFPGFITAKAGKVQEDSALGESLPLIIAGAGLLALLYIIRRS